MKSTLITLFLAITASLALGHGDVQIGPNGGRVLEFSKNETLHGEVTVKDGKFHIALLDKDLKPVAVEAQTLTATGGNRSKPEKLEVIKEATGFSLPVVKEGQWLILQFKEKDGAKAVTARMEYDTENCDACDSPEWICQCAVNKEKAKAAGKEKDGAKKK